MADNILSPEKITYTSKVDSAADWYMRHCAGNGRDCVVILHGHGSNGDQFFSRPDQAGNMAYLAGLDVNIICPNLRDNAWMSPAAVTDLADILTREKTDMQYRKIIFLCASMGGTGALIFAAQHPELADAVIVMGGATSIRRYRDWCAAGDLKIHQDIKNAIDSNYDEAAFAAHDVCCHADKLAMPLRFYHSVADRVIPVSEMYALQTAMAGLSNAEFTAVPPLSEAPNWWNDHDAPLAYFKTALDEILSALNC